MKKLTFYFLLTLFLYSCSTTKYVPENEFLLTKNTIYVDSVKTNSSELSELLLQKPNATAIGLPLSLYFYNLGNPNGSEDVAQWKKNHPKWYNSFKSIFSEKQSISVARTFIDFNNWFLRNGQAPVIIDDVKTKKTINNLKTLYQTKGFFRTKVSSKKDSTNTKKGSITYYIEKGKPSFLDSIYATIKSPVLDSIYKKNAYKSFLKVGDQYKDQNFIKEANRIVTLFRNNGVYHFSENNILFEPDSTKNYEKINLEVSISDRILEQNGQYISKPFKIQKIKNVNIYTDYSYNLKNEPFKNKKSYEKINFFSHDKLKYNPRYLSQSIFVRPNQVYTDSLRSLTRSHLRGLKNFKALAIRYNELNDDELEANIFLTPIEKYTLGFETELSRSNIRNYDISAQLSVLNRNVFKGAELFKLSLSGSFFNSKNGTGWEIGGDASIEIPRFMAPFGLNKWVPKTMFPKTRFFIGTNLQKNIGLDRQNFNIGLDYRWNFNKKKSIQIEFFNTQYIRNLNVENYFDIYNSEYRKLNKIANAISFTGNLNSYSEIRNFMLYTAYNENIATNFPNEYQQNLNVLNRYRIITSDFLIPIISYQFTYKGQKSFKDQNFTYFRPRIANSGNVMGFLTPQNNTLDKKTLFKIPIAQYFKTDLEYKKFWKTSETSVLGIRAFAGAIIPYGDSNIPFSKSYFAGGSNDIRAWRTYDLGPGRRSQGLEYNIGSLKLLGNIEYRFDMIGSLKGALFIDGGNIWDITDNNLIDDDAKLNDFKSITDVAIGAGFGIRYDLKFLVARFDIGFKAREPYLTDIRWFQNFNFSRAVYNIGINYPF